MQPEGGLIQPSHGLIQPLVVVHGIGSAIASILGLIQRSHAHCTATHHPATATHHPANGASPNGASRQWCLLCDGALPLRMLFNLWCWWL